MDHYRTSTLEDAEYLGPRLREADKEEIKAASGSDPVTALVNSFNQSNPCNTMLTPSGEPVGMFGLCPTVDGMAGAVWALATDELLNHRKTFMRFSKQWIIAANDIYPVLFNFVDARNSVHIRWLRAMGFIFINRHLSYGTERREFIEFVRINDV